MRTGIGWRHAHYSELLQRQPPIDFLEVHSENFFAEGGAALDLLRQARALYPVSLHGVGLSLGSAVGIDEWHLDQLQRLVERIEPVRVSDHACFARGTRAAQAGPQAVHAGDLLPVPLSVQALDAMVANVHHVQDRLKRPISVENISAYVEWKTSAIPEPEFLASLARRTGCGLLIDVNNLYVNALNDQLRGAASDPARQCRDWLGLISPATVTEIHLAGHLDCGDIVIDDHGSRVCPEVWSLYEHALMRFGAVPTLIEWDTAVPALDVLLQQARQAHALAQQASSGTQCSAPVYHP